VLPLYRYLVGIEEEEDTVHPLGKPLQHTDKVVPAVRSLLLATATGNFLMVPECEILDRSDFHDFFTINLLL
jgi:hypothetical protein